MLIHSCYSYWYYHWREKGKFDVIQKQKVGEDSAPTDVKIHAYHVIFKYGSVHWNYFNFYHHKILSFLSFIIFNFLPSLFKLLLHLPFSLFLHCVSVFCVYSFPLILVLLILYILFFLLSPFFLSPFPVLWFFFTQVV